MSRAVAEKPFTDDTPQMIEPKKGDRLRCLKCGMEMEVTASCKTTGGHHVRLECCGQPLTQEGETGFPPA